MVEIYLKSNILGSSELESVELVFLCSLILFPFFILQRQIEHPFYQGGIQHPIDGPSLWPLEMPPSVPIVGGYLWGSIPVMFVLD